MYGIFTYIYNKNQPKVGKYTILGWYGHVHLIFQQGFHRFPIFSQSNLGRPSNDFIKSKICITSLNDVTPK